MKFIVRGLHTRLFEKKKVTENVHIQPSLSRVVFNLWEARVIPVEGHSNRHPSREMKCSCMSRKACYSALCKMLEQRDVRVIMFHEFKTRHTAAETYHYVERAWGVDSPLERTMRRCFEKFRAWNQSLQHEGEYAGQG